MSIIILLLLTFSGGALGHTRNTDNIAFFEAYLPAGEYCAPRKPVTTTFFFFSIIEVRIS